MKTKFAKLRRNYNTLEQTHKDIKTTSGGVEIENDCTSVDLNSLVVESTLRKENRQLNDLLRETISKNERLIQRVGAIEKEQKSVSLDYETLFSIPKFET